MSGEFLYSAVQDTVKRFNSSDPFIIAEGMGIDVHFERIGSLKGLCAVIEGSPHIIISESISEYEQKMTAAHELGHIILHGSFIDGHNIFTDMPFYDTADKPEVEADTFAANLLISDSDILSYTSEGYTAENIAKMLFVSPQFADIKIRNMIERGVSFNFNSA